MTLRQRIGTAAHVLTTTDDLSGVDVSDVDLDYNSSFISVTIGSDVYPVSYNRDGDPLFRVAWEKPDGTTSWTDSGAHLLSVLLNDANPGDLFALLNDE